MYRLQVKNHFDAAHFLKDYQGKCSRMHGHRWEVEVCVEGELLDRKNMLIDFSVIKKMMQSLLDGLDHFVINERLREENATAEFIAKWFFDKLTEKFRMAHQPPLDYDLIDVVQRGVKVVRVCIWESPECCVKYSLDMNATGTV